MATSRPRVTVAVHLAKRGWPFLLGAGAVCYAAFAFDWGAVLAVVTRISAVRFLCLESALILCIFAICGWRWAVAAGLEVGGAQALRVYMYTSVSVAIGQITPMQIGEVLKLRFAQTSGLAVRRSAISMVVERIVDLAVVIDLALAGLMGRYGASFGLTGLLLLTLPIALLCLPFLLGRLQGRYLPLARLLGDAEQILRPSRLAPLIALTFTKWVLAALTWQVALGCVGCWIGFADCLLTIATVSVVTVLSMVPGGVGIQELSLTAMLVALGNPPGVAQAGSIAVRLVLPVMVLLGLAHLPGLVWRERFPAPERS